MRSITVASWLKFQLQISFIMILPLYLLVHEWHIFAAQGRGGEQRLPGRLQRPAWLPGHPPALGKAAFSATSVDM
jgi:hypothetical protein